MPAWTVPELFLRVWKTLLRQPLPLLFALAVVPGLWAIPAELAYAKWVPGEPALGTGRPAIAVLLSFAGIVWNSIWAAGGIRIGIDAARGQPVRFRHLLDGVAYTPWIVLTSLTLVPLEFVVLLPFEDDPSSAALALGAAVAVTVVLLTRTALWAPFMLDGASSIRGALIASWQATRERTARILLLAWLLFLPIVPAAAIELALAGHGFVAIGLGSLFYTLTVGHLYTLARDGAAPSLQKA